jgi:sensor c-di-GMP phosphodiesterase-like protein
MAALKTATLAGAWLTKIARALCQAWHFSQLLSAVVKEKACRYKEE